MSEVLSSQPDLPEVGQDQEQEFDPVAFLDSLGIGHLAGEEIQAHGRVFTVGVAIAECRPFADMIQSVAQGLEYVPDKATILENVVRTTAQSTMSRPVPEEVKKKIN